MSRVEGHGKVTLLLDEHNHVQQVRLHIAGFRGFEKFIEGRPYWEVPVMVQRLCGICPVSHHLAASKAFDRIVGAQPITRSAEKIRRLMHYGQVMQSHALDFFHLASPDLLFGFKSDVGRRNIVGVVQAHPDIARKGVLLRKFGQEVIRVTAGKRVHGTGSVAGGVNKHVSAEDRALLQRDMAQMVAWAQDSVAIAQQLHGSNPALYDHFGSFRSNQLSLVRDDGAMDLYDGVIRARDANGGIIFDGASDLGLPRLDRRRGQALDLHEVPLPEEPGAGPGLVPRGPAGARAELRLYPQPVGRSRAPRVRRLGQGRSDPRHAGLPAYHSARMIEMLHCVEVIQELLDDPDILAGERMASGPRQRSGIGVIEAPRGPLIHHDEVGDNDLVTMCNLIVSTTHNNQAMNEAVRSVARQ